ncbi:MAG: hypothetical protein QOI47_1037 [Actinomycetota bacterium]|jgi:hypothetical protein|nr:hypothetical protein [Actinomycetota bacterium]
MSIRCACAAALVITAAIHVAVVPEHLREWPAAAVVFVALAALEGLLAVAVLARPSRSLLRWGTALSVASAVLWLMSRTVGLPLGPEAFSAEALGAPDVIATSLEVLTALLFVTLLARPHAIATPAWAGANGGTNA